ncbi:UDP-N-acetylglucosamine 2-epimerase (non-hydrolyzing) [Sphingomonas sp. KR1UV-12]|uniref:UDP-N-acetylglucosamine 2-epimerase (non-hydrolyzing) n=1 Tax=Sphingomonas aurea TaxID=3063994 RepID=A0ABT9EIE3_9SPHN|nr:UDP-N-acetylglucosamine 2-epimerase (non-hydrolyzing) [Sphingomonas sp. KR1UV-12]MDP1026674.1 UDP-N-acetylglucosamine 2-epimerase (non-hydrolyzing) [Sphingomonas sp. KR1UV-12]
MQLKRVLVVVGTRPETIKLFPVIHALQACPALDVVTCTTGQHREMVDQVLAMAAIRPAVDLAIPAGLALDRLSAALMVALGEALDRVRPDLIVVQGDTVSAMTAALAALYRHIPVAHVEAGLRSGSLHDPCPEEGYRRIITALSTLHFAPTAAAAETLRHENVRGAVHLTGNTVIDALAAIHRGLDPSDARTAELRGVLARFGGLKLVFTTVHRRESIAALDGIARALRRIADRGDAAILLPVHPNPAVGAVIRAELGSHPNIALTEPLDYPNAVNALSTCDLVLTDSGGLQEEAPFFGKPVLVMRDTTERPEGIAAGTAKLVGTGEDGIVAATAALLDSPARMAAMAMRHLPYGTGEASGRIASLIDAFLR